jgi:ribosomal protection tetracycline resistance protein
LSTTTLNLGVLAHVDAGKTTLTERLLLAAGVIDEPGSVDAGTTRTDSLDLERRRGITIKAAVVSFPVGDRTVNLIDTPGHPDFIAEVERALGVLDGAVLVVSAVEGVQPQTRILMRALQRLRVPTLVFVNKIDRGGADPARALAAVAARLSPAVVAMGAVDGAGGKGARFRPYGATDAPFGTALTELLADRDDALMATFVEHAERVTYRRLRAELAAATARAGVHPVFFGSAMTGAGVEALMAGLAELLPAAEGDPDAPASGSVFKIERGPSGERLAYVRMFAGTVHTRDRVPIGRSATGKVTAVHVFHGGSWVQRREVVAGEIARLWGLAEVQVGDPVGVPPRPVGQHHFAPPTLETVVVPARTPDGAALRAALGQLAEQDPLIDVRQDDRGQEISVSLYGEVQKEVIQATLAAEYGIDVSFTETTTIYVERPARAGAAVEVMHAQSNPFAATIGLRVEPAAPGSGVVVRVDVDPRTVPLYVFGSIDAFAESMTEHITTALREGLHGWQVTDCVVTMVESSYQSPDGPPSTRGPLSTAADFRRLAPVVVMRTLKAAGTVVCEPMSRITVDAPVASAGAVLATLGRLGGSVLDRRPQAATVSLEALLPAARVHDVYLLVPGLTGGEGVVESRFAGHQPVIGAPPSRRRTTTDPLDLAAYLRSLGVPASR